MDDTLHALTDVAVLGGAVVALLASLVGISVWLVKLSRSVVTKDDLREQLDPVNTRLLGLAVVERKIDNGLTERTTRIESQVGVLDTRQRENAQKIDRLLGHFGISAEWDGYDRRREGNL